MTKMQTVDLVLSICIPTYNRASVLKRNLDSLLRIRSKEFEVVVIDNASTDSTQSSVLSFDDSRVRYIRHEINVGGLRNTLDATQAGSGLYTLFCLDKDELVPSALLNLISTLKQIKPVGVLYCTRTQGYMQNLVIVPRELELFLCRSRHPSGFIFLTEAAKKVINVERLAPLHVNQAFPLELLAVEIAVATSAADVEIDLVIPEGRDSAAKVPSHTYIGRPTNLWFTPKNRAKLLASYCRHLVRFGLDSDSVLSRVYRQEFGGATLGYRSAIGDRDICLHHRITPRKLGVFRLSLAALDFLIVFLSLPCRVDFSKKMKITLSLWATRKRRGV